MAEWKAGGREREDVLDEKGRGTAMQSAVWSICHNAHHDYVTFWSLGYDSEWDSVGVVAVLYGD